MTFPFDFSAKFPPPPPPEEPRTLSVGELNRRIKQAVEEGFDLPAWVEGEVVGARPASSGHLYFTLKDETEDAAVDVAMYKTSITARARKLIVECRSTDDISWRVQNCPLRLSSTPPRVRTVMSRLGLNNDQMIDELQLDEQPQERTT